MAVVAAPGLREQLDRGHTLPASWYSDPEIHRLEQERIFRRSWQYAGPAELVAQPGTFFTCRAGEVPIVVTRDRDGVLRGFVNVCRHRGHEVASGCGKRESLQCPYHAWTYGLDGSLRAAPRSEREPGFDHAEWGLRPVRVATWGPLVFVDPADDDVELEDVLGELPQVLLDRGLDVTKLAYRGRSRDWVVEANWKVVVENYLECYHCPVAHKSFSRLIDVDPDAYALSASRWSSSQLGAVPKRVEDGDSSGLPYVPDGLSSSHFHYLWPNWTFNVLPGAPHLRVLVFEPDGPERTRTYADGFWDLETPEDVVDEITEFGAVVGEEDRDLVESVQRGLRSGAIEHGRLLLGSEHLLQHFQRLVLDALTEEPH
jgi:choline monooxygenase